ncbi:hypothetical protein RR46_00388 [Papilio xuthus]|uniref:Uncharacterized protein n=1 Tax=Papilio xuthus TaxID=66420 RepID=A0A0N1PH72_PAPXU|nr:hypothetical protein RR46_00388 [Papilio xuthus]
MQPKDRILCRMLEKYARTSVKFQAKKLPGTFYKSNCYLTIQQPFVGVKS